MVFLEFLLAVEPAEPAVGILAVVGWEPMLAAAAVFACAELSVPVLRPFLGHAAHPVPAVGIVAEFERIFDQMQKMPYLMFLSELGQADFLLHLV